MKIKKESKELMSACIAVAILYAALQLLGITCPIKYFTGISCAGCGMTRAYLSLIKLDIKGAFDYHPLWLLVPVALAGAVLLRKHSKPRKIFLGILAVLFIAVYFIRLADASCTVVVWHWREGLLCRIFCR